MEKVLRSLLHEQFDLDTRNEIELISLRRDLHNKEKQDAIVNLLQDKNIESEQLAPGTNRFAFKLAGYVVKVATDLDGKIDNLKEFKMAPELFPYVANTYEVSDNGTLLVAEYIQPFTSFAKMCRYKDQILEILAKLSDRYLIGDVGLSSKNYANWGIRMGTDDPVCLDFAYVYEISSKLFICHYCNSGSMLVPTDDYSNLKCPSCGRAFTFENIREKLGNDIKNHDIGDLEEVGYKLDSSNKLVSLDQKRSYYLKNVKKSKLKKNKEDEENTEYDLDITPLLEKEKKQVKLTGISISRKYIAHNNDNQNPTINVNKDDKPKVVVQGIVKPKNDSANNATIDYEKTFDRKDEVSNEEKLAMVINMEPFQENSNKSEENKIKENTDNYRFIPEFINPKNTNIYKTLSHLSNDISDFLKREDIWDDVKGYMVDDNYTDSTIFYNDIQNIIFKSLAEFLHFSKEKRVNSSGVKKHVFIQPISLYEDYTPTLIFLEKYWYNRFNRDAVTGEFSHIQDKWLNDLMLAIMKEIPITETGAQHITIPIGIEWCNIDFNDILENSSEESKLFDESISIEITIGGDPRFDLIKLYNGYIFEDNIYTPIFKKWDDIDISSNHDNDPINNEWSWLKYMVPTNIALVDEDYLKYIDINKVNNFPSQNYRIKVAYLGKVGENKYAIGIYVISNILKYDDGINPESDTSEIEYIIDTDDIMRINNVICDNMENSDFSYYKYSMDDAKNQEDDNAEMINQLLADAQEFINHEHCNCECHHETIKEESVEIKDTTIEENVNDDNTKFTEKVVSSVVAQPIQAPPLSIPLEAIDIDYEKMAKEIDIIDDIEDFVSEDELVKEEEEKKYNADELNIETFDINVDNIKNIDNINNNETKENVSNNNEENDNKENNTKKRMITPIIPDKYKK